ncbi:MAG TPA: hypothetical protein VEV82_08050 [Actinomycetota bacterium]|nr:hypothetical protein [Actinomycetota bacterium]
MRWWMWVLAILVIGGVGTLVQYIQSKRAMAKLADFVAPGEVIHDEVPATAHGGMAGGVLVVTDRRILFVLHGAIEWWARLEDLRAIGSEGSTVRLAADSLLAVDCADGASAGRIVYAIELAASSANPAFPRPEVPLPTG